MPVATPFRAIARARLTAIVLLPTPPLALLTAITLLTFGIGRFSGKPRFIRATRFGGVPERGSPCSCTISQTTNYASLSSIEGLPDSVLLYSVVRIGKGSPGGFHGLILRKLWKKLVCRRWWRGFYSLNVQVVLLERGRSKA